METLSFVFAFGMVVMVVIGLVIAAVVNMLRVTKMQETLANIENWINTSSRDSDAKIRNVETYLTSVTHEDRRELNSRIDEVHQQLEQNVDKIYRYTDSRLDKLENKFNKQ